MIGLSAIDKRLQESFGIKKNIDEVTVGNMVRLMGIPETDAIRLHSLYGNSNVIAEAYKVYYDFYKKNQISDQVFMYLLSNFVKQYKNLLEEMREFFKRFPKEELIFVKRIKNKEFTDVDDLFSAFKHLSIEKQYRKPNLPVVLSFDDGFRWVLLRNQKDCDDEGILMKHCGGAHGTMYSLRDSNDKPHVTADVEYLGNEDWKNMISQLRGRANTQPKEQYTAYIVAFAKKMNAILYDKELDKEYKKNINLKAFFDKKIDNDSLTEMTVGNMVRLMKIQEKDAKILYSAFGNSNIAPVMYKLYISAFQNYDDSDDSFSMADNFIKQYSKTVEEMKEFFKRFPKIESSFIKKIQSEEITEISEFIYQFKHLESEKIPQKNHEKLLSFEDGYSWVLIDDEKGCRDEGGLMKHCGQAVGKMLSLRDEYNKPHVTVDLIPRSKIRRSDELDKFKDIIHQLRGYANSIPKQKYFGKIIALMKKVNAPITDKMVKGEIVHALNLKALGFDYPKDLEEWDEEYFGDNDDMIDNESVVHEAPTKKDSPAITAQRNLPREIVNAITSQSTLRQTVWSLSHLPKGTQSARLIRYMEDKGWRSFTVNGKKLFYHARTYKLREPVKSVPQTLYGIYSLLKPLEQDDMGREMVDLKLQKLWGIREIPGSSGMEFVQSSVPSERLLRYLTSVAPNANELADQLYRHTGISIEPITSTMEIGTPVDYKNASRTDLPDGVLPEDIIVIAEGGSMYSLLAKNFTAGVVHDSSAVIDSGSIKVQGKQDPTPSSARGEPSASGLGKDWEDLRSKYGMNKNKDFGKENFDDVQEDNVKIVGTGFLWRVYKKAKESNVQSIFLVQEGSKSIDTMRASLSYSRGGIYDENVRVARNIRKTGGLPIRAGKWETEDLGKYLRMFHRDYGTTL